MNLKISNTARRKLDNFRFILFYGLTLIALSGCKSEESATQSTSKSEPTPVVVEKSIRVKVLSDSLGPDSCQPVTLQLQDLNGNIVLPDTEINLQLSGQISAYSDSSCVIPLNQVSFMTTESNKVIYVNPAINQNSLTTNTIYGVITHTLPVRWATQVSTGIYHTCAVLSDSSVKCWGLNNFGQLGDGTRTSSNEAVPVRNLDGSILKNVSQVAVGHRFTCALINTGEVVCWGFGGNRQFANGFSLNSTTPQFVQTSFGVKLDKISKISTHALGTHVCAIQNVDENNSKIFCWGTNAGNRLGINNSTEPLYASQICDINQNAACPSLPAKATSISAGLDHTCASFSDGSVWCWGSASSGQLGNSSTAASSKAVNVVNTSLSPITNNIEVIAGAQVSCSIFIDTDSIRKVRCWGAANRNGISTSNITTAQNPRETSNVAGTILSQISSLASAGESTCATRLNGQVLCWGLNRTLPYNLATSVGGEVPEELSSAFLSSISISDRSLCGTTSSGRIKCLGFNSSFQLGSSETFDALPSPISDSSAYTQISTNANFGCGILDNTDKAVKCWGWNRSNRLGLANSTGVSNTSSVPVANGIKDAIKITVGSSSTCVLKTNNQVECFGFGANGRHGSGSTSNVTTPVAAKIAPMPRGIKIDSSSRYLIYGDFSSFRSSSSTGNLVRVTSTGSTDTTFTVSSFAKSDGRASIFAVALQTDGKILVGGQFDQYGGVSTKNIIRLNSDGSRDTSFSMGLGFNGPIYDIKVDLAGKIIAVGDFSSYDGTSRQNIARLLTNGTLDSSFNSGSDIDSPIHSVEIQADGNLILSGAFSRFQGAGKYNIVRVLATSGLVDSSFAVGQFLSSVSFGGRPLIFSSKIQTDGKILVAGDFESLLESGTTNSRPRILRLNSNGTLDSTFAIPTGGFAGGVVRSLSLFSDGNILAVGNFTTYGGISRNGVAKILSTGALDSSYNPGSGLNNSVDALDGVIQSDQKPVIVGNFTGYNGSSRNRIVRTLTTGAIDTGLTFGTGFADYETLLATEISGAADSFCAIGLDKTAYCWGFSFEGSVGSGMSANGDFLYPRPVHATSGVGILGSLTSVASGNSHHCFISQSQNLFCFGSGSTGQLGLGNGALQRFPSSPIFNASTTSSKLTGVTQVRASELGTCAFVPAEPAPLKCWGRIETLLVIPLIASQSAPTDVMYDVTGPAVTDISDFALANGALCIVKISGNVECAGDNQYALLGLGTVGTTLQSPQPLAITGMTKIFSGSTAQSFYALPASGLSPLVWGNNYSGQFGVSGKPASSNVFVFPKGLFN